MQLSPADRRTIIEDLLDIQIFSSMNQALKIRVQEMKEEYVQITNSIEIQNEKVALVTAYLKKLKADNAAAIETKRKLIEENTEQRSVYESNVDEINAELEKLLQSIKDQKQINQRIKKLELAYDKLEANKTKANKELHFFEENCECPTCKQTIEEGFKNDMLTRKNELVSEIETALYNLQKDIKTAESRQAEIYKTLAEIEEKEREVRKCNASISAIDKYIKTVQAEINDLNNNDGDVEAQKKKLAQLLEEQQSLEKQKNALT
jgi:DNA repair exonuclease SbcCD ATPase subunit